MVKSWNPAPAGFALKIRQNPAPAGFLKSKSGTALEAMVNEIHKNGVSLESVQSSLETVYRLSFDLNIYLTNKHEYAQHNMSAYWMTSRLRDQSAA